jgi:hypothetical protein
MRREDRPPRSRHYPAADMSRLDAFYRGVFDAMDRNVRYTRYAIVPAAWLGVLGNPHRW